MPLPSEPLRIARLWPFAAAPLAIAALAVAISAWPRPRVPLADTARERPPEIRLHTLPVEITKYPLALPNIPSDAEVDRLLHVVRPEFPYGRLPIQIVVHAIRMWKGQAPPPTNDPDRPTRVYSNEDLLGILSDDQKYSDASAYKLPHLLVKSPYGVQVITTTDLVWGSEWGSTHVGKFVQVMAENGIPIGHPVHAAGAPGATLRDVVNDEASRFHPDVELEWLAAGLSRYIAQPTWMNRHGQVVGFDLIVDRLVAREFGDGACGGGHIPYALAVLLNVNARSRLLSPDAEAKASGRLREYSAILAQTQQADGSWGTEWWNKPRDAPATHRLWKDQAVEKVAHTGHHLEWMTLCSPDLRPGDATLAAALAYLVEVIPSLQGNIEEDFHTYLPISHGVNAVLLATGYEWKLGGPPRAAHARDEAEEDLR